MFQPPAHLEMWIVLCYVTVVLIGARITELLARAHFAHARRRGSGFRIYCRRGPLPLSGRRTAVAAQPRVLARAGDLPGLRRALRKLRPQVGLRSRRLQPPSLSLTDHLGRNGRRPVSSAHFDAHVRGGGRGGAGRRVAMEGQHRDRLSARQSSGQFHLTRPRPLA